MERGAPASAGDVAASQSEFSDGSTASSPGQNAAAQAARRGQVRDHDRQVSAAYDAGRSGMPADPDYSDDENDAHAYGAQEAAQPAASPPVPSSAPVTAGSGGGGFSLPSLPGKATAQGAPLILGAIGYCVAVNWFRYGWAGVEGWITAKFWNKVTGQFVPTTLPSNQTVSPNGQVTQHNPDSANGATNQPMGTVS